MTGRRLLLLIAALLALLLLAPASASALCNGMTATVAGATSGNDTLTGTSGADVIEGLGGNDTINGLGGADTICGDGDNDTINGGTGDDHLEGGETGTDVDTVTFAGSDVGSTGVTASLLAGTADVFGSETNTLTGFENLTGTDGFDILTGDDGPNVIDGLGRADGFNGLGGNDTLSDPAGGTNDLDGAIYTDSPGPGGIDADIGAGTVDGTAAGAGSDTISGIFEIQGTQFDDVFTGDDNRNDLYGYAGNDVFAPLGGTDSINGLSGSDTISYATETGPIVSADLSSGASGNVTAPGGNDTVGNVEGFIGSPQNDDVAGGAEDDVFDGRAGDDQLDGAGGNNTASFAGLSQGVTADLASGSATGQGSDTLSNFDNVIGSSQDDTLSGDGANNVLDGGSGGTDTVSFAGMNQGVIASLAAGTATGQGTDTLANFENLTGTNTFDDLTGDNGDNAITGLNAADYFEGLGGDDTLIDTSGGPSDQDTARYSTAGPGGITASLLTGTVTGDGVGTDALSGLRGIEGSPNDDVLIGDNDDSLPSNTVENVLYGAAGDDLLEPLRGTDRATGGPGTDRVSYTNDDPGIQMDLSNASTPNTTTATGIDQVVEVEDVIGSSGDDTIGGDSNDNVIDGLGGADAIDGVSGNDTASFAALAQAVNANLLAGTSSGQGSDTLANIDNLTGSSEGDTLTGDGSPNVIKGLAGVDHITGGLGADSLLLGPGLDAIDEDDGVVDSIDCTGGGPDSGQVDGPAPAETYTSCDTDGDAVVDFLDACPTTSGTGSDGCVPAVITPPPAQATPATPATPKKKCKKGFVKKKVKGKKKCVRKKRK